MTIYHGVDPMKMIPTCMRLIEVPLPVADTGLQDLRRMVLEVPESQEPLLGERQIRELAIQTWRLSRRVESLVDQESGRLKRRLSDSCRRLSLVLSELGVTILDPTDHPYTDGWLEVDVLAWEDPDRQAPEGVCGPWVKQTMRPIVKLRGQLIVKGEVIVAEPPSGGVTNPTEEKPS